MLKIVKMLQRDGLLLKFLNLFLSIRAMAQYAPVKFQITKF